MDGQLSLIEDANNQMLNCVDSVSGQEMMVSDVDIENVKAEIVSIQLSYYFIYDLYQT